MGDLMRPAKVDDVVPFVDGMTDPMRLLEPILERALETASARGRDVELRDVIDLTDTAESLDALRDLLRARYQARRS